jgi:hypothetical protein
MKAQVGDELVVKGLHVGDVERKGVITEVHGCDGAPPYVVRWSDGHESSFFPSSDAVVEHVHEHKAVNQALRAGRRPGCRASSRPTCRAGTRLRRRWSG